MESIKFRIKGIDSILLNNPQTVDHFNEYARAKKKLTGLRKKTDEDQLEIRRLEVESKVYWDEKKQVYIPASWLMASLCGNSWTRAKIKKAEIRSAVFPTEQKIKLHYDGEEKVKAIKDISSNEFFVKTLLLKQGQVKLAKCSPIFHNWWFESELEYDKSILENESTLVNLLEYAANYGGFGDFRPSYGRAELEIIK